MCPANHIFIRVDLASLDGNHIVGSSPKRIVLDEHKIVQKHRVDAHAAILFIKPIFHLIHHLAVPTTGGIGL